MREGKVYLLFDPRDGTGKYIGRTVRSIKKRVDAHINLARWDKKSESAVLQWVRELDSLGLRPDHFILEVLRDGDNIPAMDAAEKKHIAHYRANGHRLLNMTPGGMGGPTMLGKKQPESVIEAVRIANRKESNPERARKISESKKDMWRDPEYREKMLRAGERGRKTAADNARGKPGRPHSDETKEKLRIASSGKKQSDEMKNKISEALRGKPELTHPSGWAEKVAATHKAKIVKHLTGIDQSIVSDDMKRQDIADALCVTLDRVKGWRSSGILSGGKSEGTAIIFSRNEVLMIFNYYLGGGDAK